MTYRIGANCCKGPKCDFIVKISPEYVITNLFSVLFGPCSNMVVTIQCYILASSMLCLLLTTCPSGNVGGDVCLCAVREDNCSWNNTQTSMQTRHVSSKLRNGFGVWLAQIE